MDLIIRYVRVWCYDESEKNATRIMFVSNNDDETIDPTRDHMKTVFPLPPTKEQEEAYYARWKYFEVPYYTEDSNSAMKRILMEALDTLPCTLGNEEVELPIIGKSNISNTHD